MDHAKKQPTPTDAELRARYARTGLARMGIAYERAIQCESVRIALGLSQPPRRGKAKN